MTGSKEKKVFITKQYLECIPLQIMKTYVNERGIDDREGPREEGTLYEKLTLFFIYYLAIDVDENYDGSVAKMLGSKDSACFLPFVEASCCTLVPPS